MAYYSSSYPTTAEQVNTAISEIQQILRTNSHLFTKIGTYSSEMIAYTFQQKDYAEIFQLLGHKRAGFALIHTTGRLQTIPIDDQTTLLLVSSTPYLEKATIAANYYRLPKLSHLIQLIPEDFFLFFHTLSAAKLTQQKTGLILENPDVPYPLNHFLIKQKTSYVLNSNLADKKWTPVPAIRQIAALDPSAANQLTAMQLITAIQNQDTWLFPTQAAVNLEIEADEDELNPEYSYHLILDRDNSDIDIFLSKITHLLPKPYDTLTPNERAQL